MVKSENHIAKKFELHSAFHSDCSPIEYKRVDSEKSAFVRVHGTPYYMNKYYTVTVYEGVQVDRLLAGSPIWRAMKSVREKNRTVWKFRVLGSLLPSFFEIAEKV